MRIESLLVVWASLLNVGLAAGDPIALVCATAVGSFTPVESNGVRAALVLLPVVITVVLHFIGRLHG